MRMNLNNLAEKFLETSPHMRECLEMAKRNLSFSTKAHNRTLEEILNEFLTVNELREYIMLKSSKEWTN